MQQGSPSINSGGDGRRPARLRNSQGEDAECDDDGGRELLDNDSSARNRSHGMADNSRLPPQQERHPHRGDGTAVGAAAAVAMKQVEDKIATAMHNLTAERRGWLMDEMHGGGVVADGGSDHDNSSSNDNDDDDDGDVDDHSPRNSGNDIDDPAHNHHHDNEHDEDSRLLRLPRKRRRTRLRTGTTASMRGRKAEQEARGLMQLQAKLKSSESKQAYDKAVFMRPRYAKDRGLQLLFLRAENHDVKAAANRMISHFQTKLELFGLDKLVKDIDIADLDDAERQLLRDGHTFAAGSHDSSGRRTLCIASTGNDAAAFRLSHSSPLQQEQYHPSSCPSDGGGAARQMTNQHNSNLQEVTGNPPPFPLLSTDHGQPPPSYGMVGRGDGERSSPTRTQSRGEHAVPATNQATSPAPQNEDDAIIGNNSSMTSPSSSPASMISMVYRRAFWCWVWGLMKGDARVRNNGVVFVHASRSSASAGGLREEMVHEEASSSSSAGGERRPSSSCSTHHSLGVLSLMDSMPIRCCCIHIFCHPPLDQRRMQRRPQAASLQNNIIRSMFQHVNAWSTNLLLRTQIHAEQGTMSANRDRSNAMIVADENRTSDHDTFRISLGRFGIRAERLPMNAGGEILSSHHHSVLLESSSSRAEAVGQVMMDSQGQRPLRPQPPVVSSTQSTQWHLHDNRLQSGDTLRLSLLESTINPINSNYDITTTWNDGNSLDEEESKVQHVVTSNNSSNDPRGRHTGRRGSTKRAARNRALSSRTAAAPAADSADAQEASELFPDYPTSRDVVCGRGKPFRSFPGNCRFRELVKTFKASYDSASSQAAKTAITCQVLKLLNGQNVRFLKRSDSGEGWVDAGHDFARTKIAMTFRNLSREGYS